MPRPPRRRLPKPPDPKLAGKIESLENEWAGLERKAIAELARWEKLTDLTIMRLGIQRDERGKITKIEMASARNPTEAMFEEHRKR